MLKLEEMGFALTLYSRKAWRTDRVTNGMTISNQNWKYPHGFTTDLQESANDGIMHVTKGSTKSIIDETVFENRMKLVKRG
ncbi:hypothetical protein IPH67_00010 [bacterium]|nr:MAG: hypothetical protein IPH67_00010 [bacterium]